MRVGIFGGTFNPVHNGHLAVAQLIVEKMRLDKVIFVPSYIPPHKSVKLAPAEERFRMLKVAVKGNELFRVSDFEIRRKGKSYSVDTARYFRKLFGRQARLYFIIGADSLRELKRWRAIGDILKLVDFIVVNRPGYPFKNLPVKVKVVKLPEFGISSSWIRKRISQGKALEYFIPYAVANIIKQKDLYGAD
ncbi:MAG: nicotinate-nucleotide adenylyltransferase [Candidatus Omnitrophota bacterium]